MLRSTKVHVCEKLFKSTEQLEYLLYLDVITVKGMKTYILYTWKYICNKSQTRILLAVTSSGEWLLMTISLPLECNC